MMRWLAAGFESWTIISLLVLFAQGIYADVAVMKFMHAWLVFPIFVHKPGLEFLHQPLNITISVGGDGYIPCELSPPIPPTWSINGMLYPSSGQLPEHHRYNYTGLVIENAGVGMNGSCYFCYLVIYNGVYKSRTGCVTITKEAIPCKSINNATSNITTFPTANVKFVRIIMHIVVFHTGSTPFMIEVTTVKILETSQLAQVIMSSSPKMITFNSTIPSLTKYTSYNEPIVAGASVFKSNYYVTSTVLNTGDEQPKNFVLKTSNHIFAMSLYCA